MTAISHIIDALDIETFLVCSSVDEARLLAEKLTTELGLPNGDLVFVEFQGIGARVRIRSYVHHPGDHYRWLPGAEAE